MVFWEQYLVTVMYTFSTLSFVKTVTYQEHVTDFKCIYSTTDEYLEKLKEDPFGDMCESGSDFVHKTCGNHNHSKHRCNKCLDGKGTLLPKFCFCDKKVQCKLSKKDATRKYNCYECFQPFKSTFHHNIKSLNKCTTIEDRLPIDTEDCKTGYTGPLCSSISKRVCSKSNYGIDQLANCTASNDHQCLLHLRNGTKYNCKRFTSHNSGKRKMLTECEDIIVDDRPSPKSIIETVTVPNQQLSAPSLSMVHRHSTYVLSSCLLMILANRFFSRC